MTDQQADQIARLVAGHPSAKPKPRRRSIWLCRETGRTMFGDGECCTSVCFRELTGVNAGKVLNTGTDIHVALQTHGEVLHAHHLGTCCFGESRATGLKDVLDLLDPAFDYAVFTRGHVFAVVGGRNLDRNSTPVNNRNKVCYVLRFKKDSK